jgi:hypothetical protein
MRLRHAMFPVICLLIVSCDQRDGLVPERVEEPANMGDTLTGTITGWPNEEEMRAVVERVFKKNNGSDCSVASVSVIEKGSVAEDVYPAAVNITFNCPAKQYFGSSTPERSGTTQARYYFRKDEFGDWQSVPQRSERTEMP